MSAPIKDDARSQTRKAHTAFTYRIASVAALGGLLFGFDTAIINGAIILLRQQFQWTELQMEIAASSLLAGCILGSALAGALSDAFGRKRILLLSAAISLSPHWLLLCRAILRNLPPLASLAESQSVLLHSWLRFISQKFLPNRSEAAS